MKTKPILITAGVLVLLAGAFLFIRSRNLVKPQTTEINQFLYAFSNQINEGRTDSLLADFDVNTPPKALKNLVNLLIGKKDINSKEKPLASIHLNVDAATITIINSDLIIAKIPAKFSCESFDPKLSALTLKIHQIGPHQFKIIQVDVRGFLTDFFAYENFIKSKTLSDKDLYSPITLKAFEAAKQLKSKYDSVIWFGHLDNKTYFYVVKGEWDMQKDIEGIYDVDSHTRKKATGTYAMGLVNPDLKEIIPTEYDLIYNINGTFPGMVEVEKDNKKGFFNLDGKNIIPVEYDQIFPIDDEANLAVLKKGDNYSYLKKDMSITEQADLKIADFFPKIRKIRNAINIDPTKFDVITECNSREVHDAIYIAPSYLSDLNLVDKVESFKNPLMKNLEEESHLDYNVNISDKNEEPENWFQATFYSIRDHFVGGRGDFYDTKNIVIVDKKKNRVLTHKIDINYTPGDAGELPEWICDGNNVKAINDSLFEVKSGAMLWVDLYDTVKTIVGGPYYHYLVVKNNKLVELPDKRNFGFTKYVKMDESYLNGCYNLQIGTTYANSHKKTIDHLTPEILRYMKNEIYADYRYQFKDKRWTDVFQSFYSDDSGTELKPNVSVDDSLTAIDKYNINWINQKLKGTQEKSLVSR